MVSPFDYHCKVLEIVLDDENDLSERILKRQYRKFCLLYHPDKQNAVSSCKFVEISNAYEYLGKYMGYIDDDDYDDDEEAENVLNLNIKKTILHFPLLIYLFNIRYSFFLTHFSPTLPNIQQPALYAVLQ